MWVPVMLTVAAVVCACGMLCFCHTSLVVFSSHDVALGLYPSSYHYDSAAGLLIRIHLVTQRLQFSVAVRHEHITGSSGAPLWTGKGEMTVPLF